MKTKKKVLMGIAAGLFAVATVFNMDMLNENAAEDISLDDIEVMAKAEAEQKWWEPLVKQCYGTTNYCRYYDGHVSIGSWHW